MWACRKNLGAHGLERSSSSGWTLQPSDSTHRLCVGSQERQLRMWPLQGLKWLSSSSSSSLHHKYCKQTVWELWFLSWEDCRKVITRQRYQVPEGSWLGQAPLDGLTRPVPPPPLQKMKLLALPAVSLQHTLPRNLTSCSFKGEMLEQILLFTTEHVLKDIFREERQIIENSSYPWLLSFYVFSSTHLTSPERDTTFCFTNKVPILPPNRKTHSPNSHYVHHKLY